MSISPFPARPRPGTPESESRRARIVVGLVVLGIAASLLAYAVSPAVRHAVKKAAHSVSHVFDKDNHPARKAPAGHASSGRAGVGQTGGTSAGASSYAHRSTTSTTTHAPASVAGSSP